MLNIKFILVALALLAIYVYAEVDPVTPAPGPVLATCNVVAITFQSDTDGFASLSFGGHVFQKRFPINTGYNTFFYKIKDCTKLGKNTFLIRDLEDDFSAVIYTVTIVDGCRKPNCCSSSSSSSSCTSSSSDSSSTTSTSC